jgi:hypothetical protein
MKLWRLGACWIASLLFTACWSGDLDGDECALRADEDATIQVAQERELLSDAVADLELDIERTYCACLTEGSSADSGKCARRGTISVSVEREIKYAVDESACVSEGERYLVEASGYSLTQSDGASTTSLARVSGELYVESTRSGVVSYDLTIYFDCGESEEGLCHQCPGCQGALHFSDGEFHGSAYKTYHDEDTVIITSQSDCPP